MALVLPLVKLDASDSFDYGAWERMGRTRELIGQARLLTRIAALGPYPSASLMHKIYAAAIFRNGRRFVETFVRIFESAERTIVDVDASTQMIDNLPT